MIGYVAKDKNEEVYLHQELPLYDEEYEGWFSTPDCLNITGQFSEFDNISYEDKPIKVIIKLKKIMTEDEVINKRKNCPHVILSRARDFRSKTPVPTCNRFHTNHTDDDLIGTYEQCCDVSISGRCKIKGMKEYEEERINTLTKKV